MTFSKFKRGLNYTQLALLLSSQKWIPKALGKEALERAYKRKLTELRGVPLKVSQMLSMGLNDSSQDYKQAIDDLEPCPLSLWSELFDAEQHLFESIESISEEGLPASLGQVHQLKMKDGRIMALKLQYPDIRENMDLDQILLGVVHSNFKAFKLGDFTMPDYEKVLCDELKQEMSYLREGEQQQKVYKLFAEHDDIIIPCVDRGFLSETYLLMSWEDAFSYDEFKAKCTRPQLIKATKLLSTFYFKMVFEAGLIHADPNPGNFGFRFSGDDVQLVVYDYGSVMEFPSKKAISLLKIMQIVEEGKGDLFPWYGQLGFNLSTLHPLRSQLMAFSDMIFEPFLMSGRYDLKSWNRKDRAKAILGEHRWNFMVSAPAEMIFFMRSLQTLFFYGSKFDVGVYLRPFVETYWFRYKKELSELQTTNVEFEKKEEALAQNLVLHVSEGGRTKVQMSMPRASVEGLEDLMDESLLEKLEEENIDLDQILNKTRENGYRPGQLFSLKKGEKNINVYLE